MVYREPTLVMIHSETDDGKAATGYELVRRIGLGLDRQVFPTVADGGLVVPSEPAAPDLHLGKERNSVKRKKRSATGSWEGSSGWKGQTGWPASPATPIVRRSSAADYAEELRRLESAYPVSRVWVVKEGIWLIAHSALGEGLDREAVFVVAIPFDVARNAQGWGFWSRGSLAFAQWIGPRHTNFPHGSICAFDARDGAWQTGDSPVTLLDLYSVWAIRHLHLERFGRWPGSQAARWAYERLVECSEDELCGCGSLDRTYAECCLAEDARRNRIQDAVVFVLETSGGKRSPPAEILQFLREQCVPPPMSRYC
jgi:hypothetical protein